jgi:exonuclease SbcC
MTPIRLTLRNFLSYGDEPQTVDFTGLHVVALTGENGHGKSALLDAITWVLWNSTRASGTRQASMDDVIRLGADEAHVELEFGLNGARYVALRSRRRARGGQSGLFILDELDNRIPVGATGEEANRVFLANLLKMDDDTFRSSAYLRQGNADEFTRKAASDRKTVLANILRLGDYDSLVEKAKAQKQQLSNDLAAVQGEVNRLQQQADERTTHEEAVVEQRASLTESESRLAISAALLQATEARMNELTSLSQSLAERQRKAVEEETAIAGLRRELTQEQIEIQSIFNLLAGESEIKESHARLMGLRSRLRDLKPDVERGTALENGLPALNHAISQAQVRLEGEIGQLSMAKEKAENAAADLSVIDARLEEYRKELSGLDEATTQRTVAANRQNELQEAFAKLKADNDRLKIEISDIDEMLPLLEAAGSSCPVCLTELTDEKRGGLRTRQLQRRDDLEEGQRKLKADGVQLKSELVAAGGALESLDRQLARLAACRDSSTQLEQQRVGLVATANTLQDCTVRLSNMQRQLENGEYAATERARLIEAQAQLNALKPIVEEYRLALTDHDALAEQGVEAKYAALQAAYTRKETAERSISRLEREIAQREEARQQEVGQLATLAVSLNGLPQIKAQFTQAQAAANRDQAEVNQSREALARFQERLDQALIAERQLAERKKVEQRLEADRRAYFELEKAFGKNGVQAMIIDNALPEIMDETNRLLSRMTDHSMQVRLEMRGAKSGSAEKETLEIRIMDEVGERPYEMYSGGEAFRINLALRIALSRLLARRHGASVQTLFLDEGFGTQDAKGRERL